MPGQIRQIIGVIAAEANNIEQRQIIKGVIGEAQARNLTTVVLSNVYNPYDYDYALRLENDIYKLIFSPQLSGLILVEESFINETIRQILRNLLSKRQDLPVVSIGIYIEELDFAMSAVSFRCRRPCSAQATTWHSACSMCSSKTASACRRMWPSPAMNMSTNAFIILRC